MSALAAPACVGEIADARVSPEWHDTPKQGEVVMGAPSAGGAAASGAGGAKAPSGTGPTTPGGATQSDPTKPRGQNGAAAMSGWPAFSAPENSRLRRLTNDQYLASVQALLGVDTSGMPPIEHVSPVLGFAEIGASSGSVSSMGVSQFEDAARFVAHAAFVSGGPGRKLVPCTPSGVDDSACFGKFIAGFGPKAFRRPLTADESSRYAALTTEVARETSDPWQGLEATVSAFLQSPNFLYLTEIGEADPGNAMRYRYNAFELASRLAFFLSGNPPDDELRSAAASGKLLNTDTLSAQVTRLLSTPSAHASVTRFFASLLALDSLDTLSRPVELFPKFTPTLGAAMKEETTRVIDDLVFARDGDYRHLFDQPDTFVNAELAALYGVSAPSATDFARVTLPASAHRAGLLGHAGVLAARDHSDETSPTRRGLFVLTRLLCQDLPLMPPANLQIPPPPTGLLTARDRLQEHAGNSVCASCHSVTDPVGLSLEHFDALGVYRDDDHNMAIDDTGQIDGKTYHGESELGALLRDHPALGPCLIQSLYGVAVGHLASDFDRGSYASLVQQFGDQGARIRALLSDIAASDGFRYLPLPTGD